MKYSDVSTRNFNTMKQFEFNEPYIKALLLFVGLLVFNLCHGQGIKNPDVSDGVLNETQTTDSVAVPKPSTTSREVLDPTSKTTWCLNDIKSLIRERLSSPYLLAGISIINPDELQVAIRNIDDTKKPTYGGCSVGLKYANNKWVVSNIKCHNYPPDDCRYEGTFLTHIENNWCLSDIHKILNEKLTYSRILSIVIMTPTKLQILITNMKEIKPLDGVGQMVILEYDSEKWSIKKVSYWTS